MKDVRGRAKREREYLDSIHVRSCAHCGRMFSTRIADKLVCSQVCADKIGPKGPEKPVDSLSKNRPQPACVVGCEGRGQFVPVRSRQ
jgi:hypothetical protein